VVITTDTDPIDSRARGLGWVTWYVELLFVGATPGAPFASDVELASAKWLPVAVRDVTWRDYYDPTLRYPYPDYNCSASDMIDSAFVFVCVCVCGMPVQWATVVSTRGRPAAEKEK
jgi:hypothetical protein